MVSLFRQCLKELPVFLLVVHTFHTRNLLQSAHKLVRKETHSTKATFSGEKLVGD